MAPLYVGSVGFITIRTVSALTERWPRDVSDVHASTVRINVTIPGTVTSATMTVEIIDVTTSTIPGKIVQNQLASFVRKKAITPLDVLRHNNTANSKTSSTNLRCLRINVIAKNQHPSNSVEDPTSSLIHSQMSQKERKRYQDSSNTAELMQFLKRGWRRWRESRTGTLPLKGKTKSTLIWATHSERPFGNNTKVSDSDSQLKTDLTLSLKK